MGALHIRTYGLRVRAENAGRGTAALAALLLFLLVLGGGCAVDTAMAAAAQGRTYQRYPAHTSQGATSQSGKPQTDTDADLLPQSPLPSPPATSPPTTKPAETRGKYSNPYDRRIPLQGDTHKGYAPARRDPFKR